MSRRIPGPGSGRSAGSAGFRRAVVVVAAIVSALVVSSCGTAEAGSAAVVGDRRVSVASVQSGYESMQEIAGADGGFTQALVLDFLILEPYYASAASSIGRGVTLQDAPLLLNVDPKITPTPAASQVLRSIAAYSAITSSRTAPEVTASLTQIATRLKADGVHINPRYGAGIDYSLDVQQPFLIIPETQNWIASTPAPPATAPADGSTGQVEPTPAP